jgi:glycosyltransferase involved in cell wall biosynthesis
MIQSSTLIEFVGEVNEQEKDELLGKAYASLHSVDWPEPFGLTMVEAMATGTPVIGTRIGSVPEVVIDGVTGFVRGTLHDLTEAVELVGQIDRAACRAHVERRFSAEAMARGYELAYASCCGSLPFAGGDGAWLPHSSLTGGYAVEEVPIADELHD